MIMLSLGTQAMANLGGISDLLPVIPVGSCTGPLNPDDSSQNTAVGSLSLYSALNVSDCTALGFEALYTDQNRG